MVSVSEALIGQLYLVSAVALLVGNIGQDDARRRPTDRHRDRPRRRRRTGELAGRLNSVVAARHGHERLRVTTDDKPAPPR